MADAKQYELVFLLKAQLDAAMQSQFSLAAGQLKKLEEQKQQYDRALRDIDAYRQQEAGVEALEKKLKDQEKALSEVTKGFDAATARVKAADAEYQKHCANVDALKLKLAQEKAARAETDALLKQENADRKELNQTKAQQTAELEKTKAALEKEIQAQKTSKTALDEKREAEKKALDQKNALQKSMDALREKLGGERKKLLAVSEALKNAGVDTKDLDRAVEELGKQLEEAGKKAEDYAGKVEAVSNLADRIMALKTAADAVRPALREAVDFFGESLEAAATLEYSMSAVEAVAGATQAEAARLTAVVKEMGATTVYTAEQCAQAMQNEALAGWSVEQMLSGLPAVIKLAAASGEDLAEMTSIVADGMNAFQLAGEDAAVKFADVLAKAATSSNTNVALLGDSLSYVETTAGNLGYSIEDVSLALAAMANNALKGGVSGSALNTILTRMSGSNLTAAKQMEKMGLSMYYTADAMGHAEGEAKDLKTFLDELRAAFADFGDDAQAAQIAAYNLAGMRGMRGLLAIVNQSEAQWERLTADIYDYAGAADEISGIRMDNYTGQVYLLTSAWDALKTSVGEQFLPVATDAAAALTDITNGANEFVQDHGVFVRGLGAGATAALGLLTAVSAAATGVQALKFVMQTLNVGQLLSVVGGFGGLFGLAAVAGVAFAGYTVWAEKNRELQALSEQARETKKTLEETGEAYASSAAQTAAATGVARGYLDRLEELERVQQEGGETGREYHNILVLLSRAMPELADSIDLTRDRIEGGTQALRAQTDAWEERARAQAEQEYLNSLYDQYNDVSVEAVENSYKLTQAQLELANAQKEREAVLERMKELEGQDPNYHGGYFDTDVDRIDELPKEYKDLQARLADLDSEIRGKRDWVDAVAGAIGLGEEQKQALLDAIAAVDRSRSKAASAASRDRKAELADLAMTIEQYETITGSVEALAQAYTEAYAQAYENYSGIFGLFEKVEKPEKTTMKELTGALQSQSDYFQEYYDNLSALAQAAAENGIDLSGVWGRLTDGSQDSAAAVKAMADSVKNGDLTALQGYMETYNDLLEKIGNLSTFYAEQDGGVIAALEQAGEDIKKAVEETNAAEEAYNAMEATIQGYLEALDGTGNGVGRVDAALAAAGTRWRQTVAELLNADSPVVRYRVARDPNMAAYAGGTDNARPGWSLVGEEGPELMFMGGGERVLSAPRTAAILDRARREERNPFPAIEEGGGRKLELTMNFNVSGNATPETVRSLRSYSGEIEGLVKKVLREEALDARRRSFR